MKHGGGSAKGNHSSTLSTPNLDPTNSISIRQILSEQELDYIARSINKRIQGARDQRIWTRGRDNVRRDQSCNVSAKTLIHACFRH
eukprot:6173687-Pleurochrysis_carterae.AAC.1